MTAITTQDLTVRFGNFTAVNRVSISVEEGEILGFLGPNGSGKTTLIKALCGLLTPAEGRGSVLGFDCVAEADQIRQRVGYMSQKFSLYEDLTVMENIEFYAGVYGLRGDYLRRRKDEAIALMRGVRRTVPLPPGGKLSGGWKQRLALACAFIHEPRIVFLDNRRRGSTPSPAATCGTCCSASRQGVTLFVTTHYMDEAERCTGSATSICRGSWCWGKPAELKRLPAVTPPGTRRYELRVPRPAGRVLSCGRSGARRAWGRRDAVRRDDPPCDGRRAPRLSVELIEGDWAFRRARPSSKRRY